MTNSPQLTGLASEKFIHLTTKGRRTGQPHLVELWFAVHEGRVYLSHEGQETDWMKNIRHDSEVAFDIGGQKFVGRARYLRANEVEAMKGKTALYEKYYGKAKKETIEDWFSLSTLILIEII